MSALRIAGTGHRPNKLGGYSAFVRARLQRVATDALVRLKPTQVISGMALGWDTALAEAAVELRIPFVAAVPFVGHELAWPQASREQYRNLLTLAERVHVVCDGDYESWKMQARNEWMVNECDAVLALWNNSAGGTRNCVRFAESINKPVHNVWEQWLAVAPLIVRWQNGAVT